MISSVEKSKQQTSGREINSCKQKQKKEKEKKGFPVEITTWNNLPTKSNPRWCLELMGGGGLTAESFYDFRWKENQWDVWQKQRSTCLIIEGVGQKYQVDAAKRIRPQREGRGRAWLPVHPPLPISPSLSLLCLSLSTFTLWLFDKERGGGGVSMQLRHWSRPWSIWDWIFV